MAPSPEQRSGVAARAVCETCGRVFYSLFGVGRLCDVPSCRGYLHHIDRGRCS